MCRYKKWERIQLHSFIAEGNNGGDYIHITKSDSYDDGIVHLEIGHCCVVMVDAYVPVEFITSVFSEISENLPETMSRLWPTEYGKGLSEKIVKHNKHYDE